MPPFPHPTSPEKQFSDGLEFAIRHLPVCCLTEEEFNVREKYLALRIPLKWFEKVTKIFSSVEMASIVKSHLSRNPVFFSPLTIHWKKNGWSHIKCRQEQLP